MLLPLGTIVFIPPAVEKYWQLLYPSSPMQELSLRIITFIVLLIIMIYELLKGSSGSTYKKLAMYSVFSVFLIWEARFIVPELVVRFTSEPQIREKLAKGLAYLYNSKPGFAATCFSDAKAVAEKAGSNWTDAGAFIAACEQEFSYYQGNLNPESSEFKEAKKLALKAKENQSLTIWLTLLEAQARSESGDEGNAQNVLNELALNGHPPPEEVLYSLDMLFAINSRRLHRIDDAEVYYKKAHEQVQKPNFSPFWKIKLITKNDKLNSQLGDASIAAQVNLTVPYSEMLWEAGHRREAMQVLAGWSVGLTNQPYLTFPVSHNLAVFQWRMCDYVAAEQTFQVCSNDLVEMAIQGFEIEEYRASLYVNWVGLLLEELPTNAPPQNLKTLEEMLSQSFTIYTNSKQRGYVRDHKLMFQMYSDSAILKSVEGDWAGALSDFKQLEHDSGNFDGCDPSSVARFFAAYRLAANHQVADKKESLRLSAAATYWWFKADEPERATRTGLESF